MTICRRGAGLAAIALAAGSLAAQEPAGPPPPSSQRQPGGAEVLELLPDIGRIGSEVGLVAGVSWNPYEVGQGFLVGGFIDLPLTRVPGGKLSYEIYLGLSLARSDPFTLSPPEGAPGPTRQVESRLRLVDVAPFSLKYALLPLDHARVRPYVVLGADVLIADTVEEPLVGRSPELDQRGIPAGDVGIELGGHVGAGLELRLSRGLSFNLDYRFTAFEGHNARLQTVGGALGIHW